MTSSTTSSPVDPAAVEAAKRVLDFCDGTARDLCNNDDAHVARIITTAYAEQAKELLEYRRYLEGDDTSTIAKLTTRLTTERVVREKLVEALKSYEVDWSVCEGWAEGDECVCPACVWISMDLADALIAAAELEKQDG